MGRVRPFLRYCRPPTAPSAHEVMQIKEGKKKRPDHSTAEGSPPAIELPTMTIAEATKIADKVAEVMIAAEYGPNGYTPLSLVIRRSRWLEHRLGET